MPLDELEGEHYIGFDTELVIRRSVDRFLKKHGVRIELTHVFDNIENIKKAIELDTGIALLPLDTVCREVAAGTIAAIPLTGCRFVRPLGIIQSRHHNLSSTALGFRDLLRHAGEPLPSANGSTDQAGRSLNLSRSLRPARTSANGSSKRNS